ncbi:MAG: hypothetical protein M1825_006060 [Sarcosagium campestre]|nr:MAG: hypothetical protein M1825_006060 [Sarcosagium campestre]
MAFFGGGGGATGGGFGSNSNNNNQGTGFGGFGSSNAGNTGGFGATSNTGFGATNNTNTTPGTSLFGGASTGFGNGGAFGASNNTAQSSPFGGTKPFGASNTTTGGGLFGNTTATSGAGGGFGGFGGATSNTAQNTSSPFGTGAGTTSGALFKQPSFGTGTGTTTGTSFFGGGAGNAFGGTSSTPGAFGAGASTALTGANMPSEGTASTPYQPFTEKDGTSQSTFQSITFMAPYQKFSFEELRAADYNQGRRFGTTGGFGTNTGFGGGAFGGANTTGAFGAANTNTNTNTGLFNAGTNTGGAANTGTGFGSGAASNPFGGATGSNLFGKSAGGSLFANNAASSTQPSSGIFGTAGTGGAFGQAAGTGTGSAFGTGNAANTNNQGTGFGFGQQNANTGSAFNNTSAAPAFGGTSGGSLFGGATATSSPFGQQQQGSTGAFGGLAQNQGTQATTGNAFGGFGQNNQPKPAGSIFGAAPGTNTGAGAFGTANNQQQQNAGSLFNTGTTSSTGGSLFKPLGQTAGNNTGSLFNSGTGNSNTGTGLFSGLGGNQNQTTQASGPFGQGTQQQSGQNSNPFGGLGQQQQAKPGSLFGTNNNANTQNTGSLFGSLNQNSQPLGGSLGGSTLLGGSQQSNQLPQQTQGLSTSISEIDAFGSINLFNGIAGANAQNTGPLATPLSSAQKLKRSALLPQHRFNPSSANRMITPQKRGYGLSYSTYGTPSSASSVASTPGGLSNSLLGAASGRNLGKSLSTSNLRRNFDSNDSVLSPSAFSTNGARRFGTNSLKSLNINHSLRVDLFASPPPTAGALPAPETSERAVAPGSSLKKKVSFDSTTLGGENGTNGAHAPRINGDAAGVNGLSSSQTSVNGGGQVNGHASPPEMEQVRGNELAIVPEDGSPPQMPSASERSSRSHTHEDQVEGDYWMSPTLEEIKALPRDKKKAVEGFRVGRHGCGSVKFLSAVDLTKIDLNKLFGGLIVIYTRHCTVYPDSSKKPAVGQGLNVPSEITLENSWPRSRGGRDFVFETSGSKFEKHVERLKKSSGTRFKSYDKETGTWKFTVEHFTTYGLDYDDESELSLDDFNQSGMSVLPDTPTPVSRVRPRTVTTEAPASRVDPVQDVTMTGEEQTGDSSQEDDTFEFRRHRGPPGAFDGRDTYADEDDDYDGHEEQQSFLGSGSAGSSPGGGGDGEPAEAYRGATPERESVAIVDDEMTDSHPGLDPTAELVPYADQPLKSSLLGQGEGELFDFGSPTSAADLRLDGDWAEQLRRTVSPRKQDRQALRTLQETIPNAGGEDDTPKAAGRRSTQGKGFNTSIDLMNSLFGYTQKTRGGKALTATKQVGNGQRQSQGQGLKWPYAKTQKTASLDDSAMDPRDKAFHASTRTTWGLDSTLIYTMPTRPSSATSRYKKKSDAVHATDLIVEKRGVVSSANNGVCSSRIVVGNPLSESLALQKSLTRIDVVHGVPRAETDASFKFKDFGRAVVGGDAQRKHESLVWELASVLFDALEIDAAMRDYSEDDGFVQELLRKEGLSAFWSKVVGDAATLQSNKADSKEEEAIAHLSAHRIEAACQALVDGRNFKLSTVVALIGSGNVARHDMREQLDEWRRLKVLSEISEPIRALYELLAGQTFVCDGCKGAIEDRARTFVVADRFGLDWRQSFGLKLWYGILESEPLQVAIERFLEDVESGTAGQPMPVPWFVEQNHTLRKSGDSGGVGEDLLLGLLRIFSDNAIGERRFPLEGILDLRNHQTSPVDFRLAWQLAQLLRAGGVAALQADHDENDNPDIDNNKPPGNETETRLCLDFAWQLETAGHWLWAVFVVLHVENPVQRRAAIQALLARHAGEIGDNLADDTFKQLSLEYQIPEAWIWEAKALHARSVKQQPAAEVDYLIKAQRWDEAHAALCRHVAPQAIIEGNTDALKRLLDGFENADQVTDWKLGGQVYDDYLRLLDLREQNAGKFIDIHSSASRGNPPTTTTNAATTTTTTTRQRGLPRENQMVDVVGRLVNALPAMGRNEKEMSLHEKVAVREMSGVVAKVVATRELDAAVDKSKVLSLPLTDDQYLKHTVELCFSHYKAVIAGGA